MMVSVKRLLFHMDKIFSFNSISFSMNGLIIKIVMINKKYTKNSAPTLRPPVPDILWDVAYYYIKFKSHMTDWTMLINIQLKNYTNQFIFYNMWIWA